MIFIAVKTEDGTIKGKISFYCKSLCVTRQGFHNYLKYKDKPWKYQSLADAMLDICTEDECNDTYGRIRMHQALELKNLLVLRFRVNGLYTVLWKKSVLAIDQKEDLMESQKLIKKPENLMT